VSNLQPCGICDNWTTKACKVVAQRLCLMRIVPPRRDVSAQFPLLRQETQEQRCPIAARGVFFTQIARRWVRTPNRRMLAGLKTFSPWGV
jgi:hypothetical protein